MVIIYTQNQTYIKQDADDARKLLDEVYGAKFDAEAFFKIKNGCDGATYRVNGGPLVKVVSKEKADWIREKETVIGMM